MPVIALPFRRHSYLEVPFLLTSAVRRRTGDEWAFIYRHADDDYRTWVEAGRPKLAP